MVVFALVLGMGNEGKKIFALAEVGEMRVREIFFGEAFVSQPRQNSTLGRRWRGALEICMKELADE
jgi:hypothetical protein